MQHREHRKDSNDLHFESKSEVSCSLLGVFTEESTSCLKGVIDHECCISWIDFFPLAVQIKQHISRIHCS